MSFEFDVDKGFASRTLPFGENGEVKGKGGGSPSLHKRSAEGWGPLALR